MKHFVLLALLAIQGYFCFGRNDARIHLYHPVIQKRLSGIYHEAEIEATLNEYTAMISKILSHSRSAFVSEKLKSDFLDFYLDHRFHSQAYDALREISRFPNSNFEEAFFSKFKELAAGHKVPLNYAEETALSLIPFQAAKNKKRLAISDYSETEKKIQEYCEKLYFFEYHKWGCIPVQLEPTPLEKFDMKEIEEMAMKKIESTWPVSSLPPNLLFKYVALLAGDKFIENFALNFYDEMEQGGKRLKIEGGLEGYSVTLFRHLLSKTLPNLSFDKNENMKIKKYLSLMDSFLAVVCGNSEKAKITAVLKLLQSQGAVMFPVNFPSHMMVMYVERKGHRNFTFKLFNSGAGFNYHPFSSNPLTFSDVSTVPDLFWYSLFHIGNKRLLDTTEGADHFYKIVMALLPASNIIIPDDAIFINGQQSGSCSVKSLTLFTKYFLGEDLYRRLIYLIKAEAILMLSSVPIHKFEYKVQYLSVQLLADVSGNLIKTTKTAYSHELYTKLSELEQKWSNLPRFSPFLPSWSFEKHSVPPIKHDISVVKDQVEYRSQLYKDSLDNAMIPKYWYFAHLFNEVEERLNSSIDKNPCESFKRLTEIFKIFNSNSEAYHYIHMHSAVVYYLMLVSYEACESQCSSPLAGLLSSLIQSLQLPDDYDAKGLYILKKIYSKEMQESFVFNINLSPLNPEFPGESFFGRAWEILQDQKCKCSADFSAREIRYSAPFSLVFHCPCECYENKTFPSQNYYILRDFGFLLYKAMSGVNGKFELETVVALRNDKVVLYRNLKEAKQVKIMEPSLYEKGTKQSLLFHERKKEAFSYQDELEALESLMVEAAQYHIIGLVQMLSFLRLKQEFWSHPVIFKRLYEIIINISAGECAQIKNVSMIISTFLRNSVQYFIKMKENTTKSEYSTLINTVLIFNACLAQRLPAFFNETWQATISLYETSLLAVKRNDGLISAATLYMSLLESSLAKEEIVLKYAIFRDSRSLFASYGYLGLYLHLRIEASLMKFKSVNFFAVLEELSSKICLSASDWKGEFPFFYSSTCMINYVEASILSRLSNNSDFKKQPVYDSPQFNDLFHTNPPLVFDDGRIDYGMLISASSAPIVNLWFWRAETSENCSYLSCEDLKEIFPLKPKGSQFEFNFRFYAAWKCQNEIIVMTKIPKTDENFEFTPLFSFNSSSSFVTNVPVELSRVFRPDAIIPLQNNFIILNHVIQESSGLQNIKMTKSGQSWFLNDHVLDFSSEIFDFENSFVLNDGVSTAFLIVESPAFTMTHFNKSFHSDVTAGSSYSAMYSWSPVASDADSYSEKRSFAKLLPIEMIRNDDGKLILVPKKRYESLVIAYNLVQIGMLERAFDILCIQTLADPLLEEEYQILAWFVFAGSYFFNSPPIMSLISLYAANLSFTSFHENFSCKLELEESRKKSKFQEDMIITQLDSLIWRTAWFLNNNEDLKSRIASLKRNFLRIIDHLPTRFVPYATQICLEMKIKQNVARNIQPLHFSHSATIEREFLHQILIKSPSVCYGPISSCIPYNLPFVFTRLSSTQLHTLIFAVFHSKWDDLVHQQKEFGFIKQIISVSASFEREKDLHTLLLFMLERKNNFDSVIEFVKQNDFSQKLKVSFGVEEESLLEERIQKHFPSIKEEPVFGLSKFSLTENVFLLLERDISFYLSSFDEISDVATRLMKSNEISCESIDIDSLQKCSKNYVVEIEKSKINTEQAMAFIESKLLELKSIDLNEMKSELMKKFENLKLLFVPSDRLEYNFLLQCDFISCTRQLSILLFHLKEGISIYPTMNLNEFHSNLLSYFISLNEYQRAKRIQRKSSDILSSSSNKQDKLMSLIEEFIHRKDGTLAVEELIVFEVFADFRLRNSHFDDLFFLSGIPLLQSHQTESQAECKNRILSKAMGGGKSLVISTLLVKLLAKDKKVPMVVFLSSLISSSGMDLLNRTSSWFGQKGHLLYCDRPLSQSNTHINSILKLFQHCSDTGEYIITTAEYLQSLINGSNEALVTSKESLHLIYKALFNFISADVILICDEIDELAKPFSELNFVTGKESTLSSGLNNVAFAIFTEALTNEHIRSIINIEDFETSTVNYEAYKNALLNTPTVKKSIEALEDKDIDLFSKMINTVLPASMADVFQESYGLAGAQRPGQLIAVPYKSSRSPSVKSDFSDPLFVMIKTYLSYVKGGFTLDSLSFFHSVCIEEMSNQVKYENVLIENTDAWNALLVIFKNSQKCPSKISKYLQMSPAALLECVKTEKKLLVFVVYLIVMKQIRFFNSYLSSNFQDLLLLSNYKTVGYTGTLYNRDIFMNYENHFKFKLDDSITPFIIATLSLKNPKVIEGKKVLKSAKDLLDEIPVEIDSIIDAGGSLRYIEENDLLQCVKEKYKKKSTLFFRPDFDNLFLSSHEIVALSKTDEKSILPIAGPIEDRFIIYDQFHCTGVDLKQKPNAIGLLTIGTKTILRDFLQAVMRLRDLAKGQSVILFVENSVSSVIKKHLKTKEPLTLMNIIQYCLYMQNQKIGIELQTAVVHKFEAEQKLQTRTQGNGVEKVLKTRNFETSLQETSPMQKLKDLFTTESKISLYWKDRQDKFKTMLRAEMTQTSVSENMQVAQVDVSVESQVQQSIENLESIMSCQNCYLFQRPYLVNLDANKSFSFFTEDPEFLSGFSKRLSEDSFEFYEQNLPYSSKKSASFVLFVRKMEDRIIVRKVYSNYVDDYIADNPEVSLFDVPEMMLAPDGDIIFPTRLIGNIFTTSSASLALDPKEHRGIKAFLFAVHVQLQDLTPFLTATTFYLMQEMIPKHASAIDYILRYNMNAKMVNIYLARQVLKEAKNYLDLNKPEPVFTKEEPIAGVDWNMLRM